MDWTEGTSLALASLGLFLAGIIKGTSGLGYSSCALPFLVAAVGSSSASAGTGTNERGDPGRRAAGQLKRFYVKEVESGDVGDFSRMSTEELRTYVYGDDEVPPKRPKGPVKH